MPVDKSKENGKQRRAPKHYHRDHVHVAYQVKTPNSGYRTLPLRITEKYGASGAGIDRSFVEVNLCGFRSYSRQKRRVGASRPWGAPSENYLRGDERGQQYVRTKGRKFMGLQGK